MLRFERHELGPRVYVFGRRAHEYHLGFLLLAILAGGAIFGVAHVSLWTGIAVAAAVWLIAKDWRDLFGATRDTASWQLGLHRRAAPLRRLRRSESLPALTAAVALALGVVNLVSALTPNARWRGHLLVQIEPVGAMRIFHALAVPAAALLLVSSFYLYRRRRPALQLAIALLLALGVLNVVKGLDVEEAVLTFGGAALLWWGREAFHVHYDPPSLRSALWRVPVLWGGIVTLSFFAVWSAAPDDGLRTIVRETGDLILWQPGPIRLEDEREIAPLAVHLLFVFGLLASAYAVFRPLAAPRSLPDPEVRRLAATIVREHGQDTLAFFKLRGDNHYLFDPERKAFVGYRVEGGVMLCSGDPVGAAEALPAVVAEAARFAERRGLKLAAISVGDEAAQLYARAGLRRFYMGDEAIVETSSFSLDGRAIRKVRQSVSRVEKSGYSAELVALGALDDATVAQLEAVSHAWRHGAPERGFSMAMDTLRGTHQDQSVVVLARDGAGAVRGFLHFVPTYGRPAMSLSFMRRDRDTPNGLTEFLVVRGIELLSERGIAEVSLNFAAFARWLHSPRGARERLLGRLVALGNPFFQIESLYRFNAKFFPRWQPRYLVYEGVLGLPRAGLAALWAEGQLPKPFRGGRAPAP